MTGDTRKVDIDTQTSKTRFPRSSRPKSRTLLWVGGVLLVLIMAIGFATGTFNMWRHEPGLGDEEAQDLPGNNQGGELPLEEDPLEGDPPDPGNGGEGQEPPEPPGIELMPIETALEVKAVYVTIPAAITPGKMSQIITFVRENPGLNSLVMDVKDNSGYVPCDPPETVPSPSRGYNPYPGLVSELKDEGYYMIARIVAFQDPRLAVDQPELAIRNQDGSLWKDSDRNLWLNPYDKRNWEHVKETALWAVEMGFHEIQLDYVRFPSGAKGIEEYTLIPGVDEFENRGDCIAQFLLYMAEALEDKAYLSADIFGFTTIATDDMGIGQQLEQISDCVDFICPMVYPSHYYNPGIYGFEFPEAHPYEVVFRAMEQAIERTQGHKAKIRPWLQDFSMKIHYGSAEVQGQIDACFERGINTFMIWNPANMYTHGVRFGPPPVQEPSSEDLPANDESTISEEEKPADEILPEDSPAS